MDYNYTTLIPNVTIVNSGISYNSMSFIALVPIGIKALL